MVTPRAPELNGTEPGRERPGLVRFGLRVVSWLRFLLVWPLVVELQRRSDRSLSWRLAGSHLATVFLSIFGVAVLLASYLLISAWLFDPLSTEPAQEAEIVAETLDDLGWNIIDDMGDVNGMLAGFASGLIGENPVMDEINFSGSVGALFEHVRSISVVSTDGIIIASSDRSLIGQSIEVVNPTASSIARQALDGATDLHMLSDDVEDGDGAVVGAYPLPARMMVTQPADGTTGPLSAMTDRPGTERGAVVVDKSDRSFPRGTLQIVALALSYVVTIGLLVGVVLGVPAIPTAAVVGVNRARAIAKPANDLARAAERLSAGDLSVRVWVPGNDEIARLARAFNRMADQLQISIQDEAAHRARAEKLLQANRDLVANVSHELRTPVALIRGHIEALADDPTYLEAYAGIALRETDRLEDLVNDLFQLARVDAQGISVDREPLDTGAAMREAVESLAEPARRDMGITMRAEIVGTSDDLTIIGDRQRLVQVLQNLLRNAVRYTPEGGIILGVAKSDARSDGVILTIQDTGQGIPPDDLSHIFERFFRSDQSRSRARGGAGLGLSISKQFIEAMHGTIAVESELNEGTIFTIWLPCAPEGTVRRELSTLSAN